MSGKGKVGDRGGGGVGRGVGERRETRERGEGRETRGRGEGKQWQCQLATIGERLAFLRDTGMLSDLTIVFPSNQRTVKCHRWLLAMSSPVFEAMLYGPLAEGETLYLPEDPPEAFEWILDYLYRDSINFPNVLLATQIYHLAVKYQLDILCESCSRYLIQEVNEENFPLVYDTASLLDDRALLNSCSQVLVVSSDKVLASDNICKLSRSSMKSFLQHIELVPSSDTLIFLALLKWGEKNSYTEPSSPIDSQSSNCTSQCSSSDNFTSLHKNYPELGDYKLKQQSSPKSPQEKCTSSGELKQCMQDINAFPNKIQNPNRTSTYNLLKRNLRRSIEEFLPYVKFLLMTTDEFVEHVLPSDVLTNEESVAILMNIKGIPNIPLPNIVPGQSKMIRKNKLKSTMLMFCQHHFGRNDQEILRDLQVSKPIYVSQIIAPSVMSKQDTDITVLRISPSPKILVKAVWRGSRSKFEIPLKLVPGAVYNVTVGLAFGSCSGCECLVSSVLEGLHINGKTLGFTPVHLEFWEAE